MLPKHKGIIIISWFIFSLIIFCHAKVWGEGWQVELPASSEQRQPMLVAFLGSDWCPWSKKFVDDVLHHTGFYQTLSRRMRCIKIELTVKPEIGAQFRIEFVPTLLLLAGDGTEVARFGFLPMQPQECADFIIQALDHHSELTKKLPNMDLVNLQAAYSTASQYHMITLQKEIRHMARQKGSNLFFMIQDYMELARNQSKDAKKLRSVILEKGQGSHVELALADFQLRVDGDRSWQESIKPLKHYLKKFGKQEASSAWRVRMILAQYLLAHEQQKAALRYAEKALACAPENEHPIILETIAHIKGEL